MVNHVGICGSKAAEAFSAFQSQSCCPMASSHSCCIHLSDWPLITIFICCWFYFQNVKVVKSYFNMIIKWSNDMQNEAEDTRSRWGLIVYEFPTVCYCEGFQNTHRDNSHCNPRSVWTSSQVYMGKLKSAYSWLLCKQCTDTHWIVCIRIRYVYIATTLH